MGEPMNEDKAPLIEATSWDNQNQSDGKEVQHPETMVVMPETMQRSTEEYNQVVNFAVFTTAFCCMMCGLCAFYRGIQANVAAALGRRSVAEQHARVAKRFNTAGVMVGILFIAGMIAYWIFLMRRIADLAHRQ